MRDSVKLARSRTTSKGEDPGNEVKELVLNRPQTKVQSALICGVLNRPQTALWCFDYYCCFIKQSELVLGLLETVRKHSGDHTENLLDTATFCNKCSMLNNNRRRLTQKGLVSFNKHIKRAFANGLSCE